MAVELCRDVRRSHGGVGWIALLAWPMANVAHGWLCLLSNGNHPSRVGGRDRRRSGRQIAAAPQNWASSTAAVDIPPPNTEEQSPLQLLLQSLVCGERSLVHLPAAAPSGNVNADTARSAAPWNEWNDDDDDDHLSQEMIRQCHCDALTLKAAGFGARAGVVRDTLPEHVSATASVDVRRPIRSMVHQIWLQTPLTNSPISSQQQQQLGAMVGYMEARRALLQWLDRLRRRLNEAQRQSCRSHSDDTDDDVEDWLPRHLVEASYAVYDANGAYYDKHLDVPTTQRDDSKRKGQRRRAISVILYLGPLDPDHDAVTEDDDTEPWSVADGGELRIHGAPHVRWLNNDGDDVDDTTSSNATSLSHTASDKDLVVQDLAPRAGTLVLFDSAVVPHEVRPTLQRGRVAVVAWFGTLF
jgi:Rps23 Pro-64 3,4-dihydroxylase Tpa1-like proline 4-hydroxylase